MSSSNCFKFEQLISNREIIKKYVQNGQSFGNFNELFDSIEYINQIAHELRYFDNLPFNGFYYFLRVLNIYFELVINQIETGNEIDSNLIKLSDLVVFHKNWLIEIYEVLKNEKQTDSRSLNNNLEIKKLTKYENYLSSKTTYNLLHANDDVLALKFSVYHGFYIRNKANRSILKKISFVVALTNRLPFSLSSIWSDESVGKNCVQAYKNLGLDGPLDIYHFSENWIVSELVNYYFNRKLPVQSVTLNIPKQNRFRLDYKGNILDFSKMTKQEINEFNNDEEQQKRQNSPGRRHRNYETIRCRYSFISIREKIIESLERIKIKRESSNRPNKAGHLSIKILPDDYVNNNLKDINLNGNENETLIIHIHAGGFVIQGSKSSEIYLRKLVNSLGGIPVLAIDYSLTVPYPVPLQEILDVYLWALSGKEEVKEKLGFYPKKIVLSGDSCGGYFSVILAILINELNKIIDKPYKNGYSSDHTNGLIKNRSIPLPMAIVTAYPLITLSKATASKCLSTFENFIEFHSYLLVTSLVATNLTTDEDFKKIENSEAFQKIVSKNQNDETVGQTKEFKISNESSTPWFNCDYKTFKNRADYVTSFYDHPFIEPILYKEKFDELKEIDLYALAGNDDVLLDDCLELASLWKGKRCLDVFENVIHGFLNFYLLSDTMNDAFEITVDRFQEACGLI